MGSSNVPKGTVNLDKTNRSQSINQSNTHQHISRKGTVIDQITGDGTKYKIRSTNVKGMDVSGRQSRDLTANLREQENYNK